MLGFLHRQARTDSGLGRKGTKKHLTGIASHSRPSEQQRPTRQGARHDAIPPTRRELFCWTLTDGIFCFLLTRMWWCGILSHHHRFRFISVPPVPPRRWPPIAPGKGLHHDDCLFWVNALVSSIFMCPLRRRGCFPILVRPFLLRRSSQWLGFTLPSTCWRGLMG